MGPKIAIQLPHRGNQIMKNEFPPLPVPSKVPSKINTQENTHDDSRTVSTVTEFSPFHTPSTKSSSSPGRYAWSLSSKKDEQHPLNYLVVDGIPPSPLMRSTRSISPTCTWRKSPVRVSRYHNSPARRVPSPSPFRSSRSSSPSWRNIRTSQDRTSPSPFRSSRSSSPSLRNFRTPIKFQRSESILELTDSDDDDSVIEDKDLRQLIRVASDTLSNDGKELEPELFCPFKSIDFEEDDGLDSELKQLIQSEANFRREISFAVDKVAYRHPSEQDWSGKFICSKGSVIEIESLNDTEKNNVEENFIDKIISVCICCTDTSAVDKNDT